MREAQGELLEAQAAARRAESLRAGQRQAAEEEARISAMSPLYLRYISTVSPLNLFYISPESPLYLPYISRRRRRRRRGRCKRSAPRRRASSSP